MVYWETVKLGLLGWQRGDFAAAAAAAAATVVVISVWYVLKYLFVNRFTIILTEFLLCFVKLLKPF